MTVKQGYQRDVYIIDGSRTPFLKARGEPGPFSASDLAVNAGRELLARQPFSPTEFGEVILGCVSPSETEANIARIIALRLGCGKSVPAWTVQRNCASGMQALDCAAQDIASGRHDLVLAGGTEAMSRAPLIWNKKATQWFAGLSNARKPVDKLAKLAEFRFNFLQPIISILSGLTDPVVGISMGQTAENLAARFGITREEMDSFSLRSNERVAKAQAAGLFSELVPMIGSDGKLFGYDDGVRPDTTMEKLNSLKPFFDKKFGQITPGNSSQITDGAALVILASEDAVKRYNLPIMGRIVDCEWGALDPAQMGLGPVFAATPIIKRHQLALEDIGCWEINEAFAAQVIACLRAWESEEFCQQELGLTKAFGKIDENCLNVDGGAIAMGHPVGASGARIVLHLLNVLKRKNAKTGMAAICIGGGQGGAMLIESR
ncbi:MAG: acetyl-CoA C-acetyltransferase [Gammaproteobacteria bacterium]|nr:acetyl-CoA C-acetyltransferase [Gammaproteobacteria bacterium]